MMHDTLRADVLNAMRLAKEDSSAKDEVLKETAEHVENMLRLMKENSEAPLSPQVLAALKELEAPVKRYTDSASSITKAAFESPDNATKNFSAFMEDFTFLEEHMEKFSTLIETSFKDVEHNVVATEELARGIVTGALAFGFLIAILTWRLSYTGIIRPIIKITQVTTQLANGKYDIDVPFTEQANEIGAMAQSLEVLRNNNKEMVKLRADQVEKDRQAKQEQHLMMNNLAEEFEKSVGQIIGSVASASTNLKNNAENLTNLSDETTRQASGVAAATEEASANVQTVASAAEELSASINEIKRQVQESTQATNDAVVEVKNTNQTVVTLSTSADQIGGVVKLIQDIAEQTNLLALNATIEAARAGEAGKGFAVVASEVKSLANQTAKATEEISAKISSMQGVTQSAVGAIRNIDTTIDKISQIINGIASAVEEQSAATREIANNVAQASAGTAEVASTIGMVTQSAQESRGASSDVLNAAKDLSTQSQRLKEEMQIFLNDIRNAS
ncbi:MAG: methyl-accepting chemotaxis protein [Alphaproteobacteria bacterium]